LTSLKQGQNQLKLYSNAPVVDINRMCDFGVKGLTWLQAPITAEMLYKSFIKDGP